MEKNDESRAKIKTNEEKIEQQQQPRKTFVLVNDKSVSS